MEPLALAERVVRCFFAHGVTVHAAAPAYRGLLAPVPFALLSLSLIGLFGHEGSLPRVAGLPIRLSPAAR